MTPHYTIDGNGFHIQGSREKFNRVLYGSHKNDRKQEKFFTLAGDLPLFQAAVTDYEKDLFCYYAKNGLLQSGLALTPAHQVPYFYSAEADLASAWFHHSEDIEATFRDGAMHYRLSQVSPWFPNVEVEISAYPLLPDDGMAIVYRIRSEQRVWFCAGFGGITGFLGRFEYPMISEREFSAEDSRGNRVRFGHNQALITSPHGSDMRIAAGFDAEFDCIGAETFAQPVPSRFLAPCPTPTVAAGQLVRLRRVIGADEEFHGTLIVARNCSAKTLDKYLALGDKLPQFLAREIHAKTAALTLITPDAVLNQTAKSTLVALDASWHGRTFYHGAHGYHTPFLGWRNWYAPTVIGWLDRVKTAILSHLETQKHADPALEKVWYDGGDRPDLDHEGTQYHHLTDSHGNLAALLHRDDIYNMQEVALDMMLHYLERTGDRKLTERIFDAMAAILDFEERIFDPDHDGLYQNFLNTWISDGHSYNGGGCAQASAYNYSANRTMAHLARTIGRDPEVFAARARRIHAAVQRHLWLEDAGVIAEFVDTVGNRLVHPEPELNTIYLAVSNGLLDRAQSSRALAYTRTLRRTRTRHGGELVHSSKWLPKKYSTYGLFPSENACLALAYFDNYEKDEAWKIVQGLLDAYELSRNPGLVRHVLSDLGGADWGDFDFTDTSSSWLWLILSGVWGIKFHLEDSRIHITPALPDDWEHASVKVRDLSVTRHREARRDTVTVYSALKAKKQLQCYLRRSRIEGVYVNGEAAEYTLLPVVDGCLLQVTGDDAEMICEIVYDGGELPQLCHNDLSGAAGSTVIVEAAAGVITGCDAPFAADIQHDGKYLRLTLGERGGRALVTMRAGDVEVRRSCDIEAIPAAMPECPALAPAGAVRDLDLAPYFNMALTEIYQQRYLAPRPEGYSIGARVNGRYAWEWTHTGHNSVIVDDTALRQAPSGRYPVSGTPGFPTPAKGPNAACVSVWENYPTELKIPLPSVSGQSLHLFCIGATNAMQSGVVNAVIQVTYTDGSMQELPLVAPDNFDDWLLPSWLAEERIFYFSDLNHGLRLVIPLTPGKVPAELVLRAVANEVILGLLGASIC